MIRNPALFRFAMQISIWPLHASKHNGNANNGTDGQDLKAKFDKLYIIANQRFVL